MSSASREGAPFSVVWFSERLYRPATEDPLADLVVDLDPDGATEVAGWGVALELSQPWEDLLTEAWQRVVARDPEAVHEWRDRYLATRHHVLVVSFTDVRWPRFSRSSEHEGMSYPADAIVDAEDPVDAFVTAIVTVLDRHVDRAGLPVPPLSACLGEPRR